MTRRRPLPLLIAAVAAGLVVAGAVVVGAVAYLNRQPDALLLGPTGIGPVDLGDPEAEVVEVLSQRWGAPVERRELGCESGRNQIMVFWDGASLHFTVDEGLVGYSMGPVSPEAITPVGKDLKRAHTDAGLLLNDTVQRAHELYAEDLEVRESTLGTEWIVELAEDRYIGGFVSTDEPEPTIDRITSGDTCVVR